MRGTTRHPERAPEILAAGAEPAVADPDRLGSLVGALDHVSVALILLGSAQGAPRRWRIYTGRACRRCSRR